jgi:hypothetical protein
MARSYFSRLVRGGESAPLAPPRPVSHLWKMAQIDAAAAPPRVQPLSPSRRSSVPPSHADPAKPMMPAEQASRSAPGESRTRISPTSVPETPRRTAAAAYSAKTEATRHDPANFTKPPDPAVPATTPSVPAEEPRPPRSSSGSTEILPQRFPTSPVSSHHEPALQLTDGAQPIAAQPMATEVLRAAPIDPNPPVTKPVAAAAERPTPVSGKFTGENATDPVRATRPDLQPFESLPPGRFREPSRPARQSSIPEEPRPGENTVHIGKIEVQVLPPPATSHRSAPRVPAKGRLARGYALWPGW